MKYFTDKKIQILSIILLVFTIGYFIVINKISYAFEMDYDASFYHDQVEKLIEQSALKYAQDHKEIFTEEEAIKYVTVQELIDNSYLIPNEDGNIIDPSNENMFFNSRKVKIKMVNNNFEVKIEPTA